MKSGCTLQSSTHWFALTNPLVSKAKSILRHPAAGAIVGVWGLCHGLQVTFKVKRERKTDAKKQLA